MPWDGYCGIFWTAEVLLRHTNGTHEVTLRIASTQISIGKKGLDVCKQTFSREKGFDWPKTVRVCMLQDILWEGPWPRLQPLTFVSNC